jgi:outer membrane protein OmpA-like peptidoglycan-associated protein
MNAILRVLAIAVTAAGATLAPGAFAQVQGYVVDSSGQPVRSGSGGCVKSGSWSADKPGKGCDYVPDPARVILLPEPDGSVGKIVVTTRSGEQLLERAYAGVEVESGRAANIQETAASVQSRYGSVLAARPPRALSYVVQFAQGSSTELAPESMPVVERMKLELVARPVPEITVIGHTDRVGKVEANDALSLKRAEVVRDILSRAGVKAASMDVVGRGEREPLVPTADEVAEPRNRRVEISVR